MTDETRIASLLRVALPSVIAAEPSADVWLRIVKRSRDDQRLSWIDITLAAGVAMAFVMKPDLLLLLAYHF